MRAQDMVRLTALQMADKLQNNIFTSVDLTKAHFDRIQQVEGNAEAGVHAFLHLNEDEALTVAAEVDQIRAAGGAAAEALHPLAGVPIAMKDNIVTVGQPTTAASKILDGWMSPYDATVVQKIRQAKLPILGKTNLDEFAMGGTTEYSAFGVTRNPWDLERVPGGSGGGSAAAVGAYMAPLALGSDTGGSIREPAAFTGTVGTKPTYGSVSRYGLIAMASSLDQIGPVARTTADAAALHELIGGHDPKDATSLGETWGDLLASAQHRDLTGVRIGVLEELQGRGFSDEIQHRFQESLQLLRDGGAEVVSVDCPNMRYALPAYYLIVPSEVSSNMARFDGIRFGNRVVPNSQASVDEIMSATRAAGFGDEVKRRIILGTYALSAGYVDAYYGSAQRVRTLVQQEFRRAFEQVDVLVSPTTPHVAAPLGEQVSDPVSMYVDDVATIPANLAGIPAISIPGGLAEHGMPMGIQIQAPARADAIMYRVAGGLEELLSQHRGHPFYSEAPELTDAVTTVGGPR